MRTAYPVPSHRFHLPARLPQTFRLTGPQTVSLTPVTTTSQAVGLVVTKHVTLTASATVSTAVGLVVQKHVALTPISTTSEAQQLTWTRYQSIAPAITISEAVELVVTGSTTVSIVPVITTSTAVELIVSGDPRRIWWLTTQKNTRVTLTPRSFRATVAPRDIRAVVLNPGSGLAVDIDPIDRDAVIAGHSTRADGISRSVRAVITTHASGVGPPT